MWRSAAAREPHRDCGGRSVAGGFQFVTRQHYERVFWDQSIFCGSDQFRGALSTAGVAGLYMLLYIMEMAFAASFGS